MTVWWWGFVLGFVLGHFFLFCNVVRTGHGGTHQNGFERALLKSLNEALVATRVHKARDEPVVKDDVLEGLTAVVTVKVPEPQYLGQTKDELGTTGWTEWELADNHGSTELTATVWTEPGIRWDGIKEGLGAARPWTHRQIAKSLRRLRKIFEEQADRPLTRAGVAGYEPLTAARYGSRA